MNSIISLSRADLKTLRNLLDREKSRGVTTVNRPEVQESITQAPETYICKTPVGGIPAMTGVIPGSAICDVYRIQSGITSVMAFNKTVYNFQSSAVTGETWVEISRDKFGQWYPQVSGGGSVHAGSGNDIHAYIHGNSTPLETYYPCGFNGTTSASNIPTTAIGVFPVIVPNTIEIDNLRIWLYSNSATVKKAMIAIYKAKSSLNPWPGDLVYSSGEISLPIVSSPGQWCVETLTSNLTLTGGILYWMGVQANGTAQAIAYSGDSPSGNAHPIFGTEHPGASIQNPNTYGAFPDPFPDYPTSITGGATACFFHRVG